MSIDQRRYRKHYIDILRGLAVLFVIFGHVLDKTDTTYIYYVFTSPIKIPLFFVISGYLFNGNRSLPDFFKRICRGLVLPWLALSLVPILAISVMKGGSYLYENALDVITGRSVWYMPCCIIAELIFFCIVKITRKTRITGVMLACVVLAIIGEVLIILHQLDLFMFNRALTAQIFLLIGYLLKKYEYYLNEDKVGYAWIGACLFIILGIVSIIFYPGLNLDVHTGQYYNPAISLSMIIIGCVSIFSIAKRYDWRCKVLEFVGRNSLIFYIWAGYGLAVYGIVSGKLGFVIGNPIIEALIQTVVICAVCTVASILINRFLPEIVGKKRARKEES